MADEPVTDSAGLTRTADGTLNNPSIQPSSTPTTTPTTPKPNGSLLNAEAAPPEPAAPADSKAPAPPAEAPAEYADYKVPDGFDLDPAVKKEADTIFKGLGLNQEQAQSLVDFYTAKTLETFQQPYKAYKEMTDNWRTESENHPDLRGKLGPGQEVNVRIARALDSLGDPKLANDFRSLMDLTGAGNNQAFIRVIDKLAQRLGEGTAVTGRGPAPVTAPGEATRPTAAAALYPHLPSVNR